MNLNFKRLLLLLLPTFLRKEVFNSFLKAVSVALQSNKTKNDVYFRELNYHIRVTPQTFSLEKMLNDKCDKKYRRIKISLPSPEPPFYFTENGSPDMQYFNDEYFMFGKMGYKHDFTVLVPADVLILYTRPYIDALINKYKLLTKTHIIIQI